MKTNFEAICPSNFIDLKLDNNILYVKHFYNKLQAICLSISFLTRFVILRFPISVILLELSPSDTIFYRCVRDHEQVNMYEKQKLFHESDLKNVHSSPSGTSVYAGTKTKNDVKHNSQNILSYRNVPGSST